MDTSPDPALVAAAQGGDRQALEELLAAHLPLVYTMVGRALYGHPDVDDVVQETMLRVVRGLPGLREPEKFRAWLVAITTRQVQQRGRRVASGHATAPEIPLDLAIELPDPAVDFVETTNERLDLADERRELAHASRWLTADDRHLLSLWWQEAMGSLTRAEVAAALSLSPQHTAVRIQRMKGQLDLARSVMRAWRAAPRCPQLTTVAGGWDRRIDPRWLKRLGRHVRSCATCALAGSRMTNSDQLAVGTGFLAPPVDLLALLPAWVATPAVTTAAAPGWVASHALIPTTRAIRRLLDYLGLKSAALLGAGVAGVTAIVTLAYYPATEPGTAPPALPLVIGTAAPPGALTSGTPSATVTAAATVGPSQPTGSFAGVAVADFYVSPTGVDTGPGTIDRPFATLSRAVSVVGPGQSIALRGGTYRPTQPVTITTSGTAERRITLSGYRDEHPIIDAGGIASDKWYLTQRASYWTVQGLEITNSPNHAYVCQSCQFDVFRRLSIHDSGNTALTLRDAGTIGNEVVDSDFFHNHDLVDNGGSADGLAIKSGSGTANQVRGCRFYENSGDGLDLTAFADPVTVTGSWAYGNGVNRWNIPGFVAAGNGIKLGGGSPAPAAGHVVTNTASWDNTGYGFTEAGNKATIVLTNNTAYRNGTGFGFVTSSAVMRHNLALANSSDTTLGSSVDDVDNSWNQSGWTTTTLRSGDPTTARAARAPDGTLPPTTFLRNRRDPTIGASMQN